MPCSLTGAQLRDLLVLNYAPARQAAVQLARSPSSFAALPENWAEFLALHCACLAALQQGRPVDAYEKAVAALQPFLKVRGSCCMGG